MGLERFLESGPRPVYVGFGSVPHTNLEQTTRLVMEALRRAGQRGVIAIGWGGLARGGASDLGDDMSAVDTIPHAWLFPRVAAVGHHGGSGTTGAGLGAGVPAVLVPHAGDQPLWARRLAQLGVSAEPIPFQRLTVERLTSAIGRVVTDPEMQARAAGLGQRIRWEAGVAQAVIIIERCLGQRA